MKRWLSWVAVVVGFCGCTPGYIKASQLEARGQGPAECAKSCEGLNMRMAALVLVGNELPGCVCQPLQVQAAPIKTENPPAQSSVDEGAAASTTGYVVLAAAAAARDQQRRLQQQQMQQQTKKY